MARKEFARRCFPPPVWARVFCPPPRRSPRKCCRWSTSPSFNTASKKPWPRAATRSSSLPAAARRAIEDHFDVSYELEKMLEERGKTDLLAVVRQISDMIHIAYVRQKEALGLGHAVLMARELVGDEPFAVILADDVIDAEFPA